MGSAARLSKSFEKARREKRSLLSVYLTAGFPDLERSRKAFNAAIGAGADFVEIGIPFSDPVADGPVLQESATLALKGGMKVSDAFVLARALRAAHPDVPFVAMTYANLAQRHGWQTFADSLRDCGIDGAIVPDVPFEEAGPLRQALAASGLAYIPLVTPTTDAARMGQIAKTSTGFLYVVANVGVTGQSDPGPLVAETLKRAKKAAGDIPLAVGFGVRTGQDVERLASQGADAVIVGSHIVRLLGEGADIAKAVGELQRGIKSRL